MRKTKPLVVISVILLLAIFFDSNKIFSGFKHFTAFATFVNCEPTNNVNRSHTCSPENNFNGKMNKANVNHMHNPASKQTNFDIIKEHEVTKRKSLNVSLAKRKRNTLEDNKDIWTKFKTSLTHVYQQFYIASYEKLRDCEIKDKDIGISFTISPLWLQLVLILLSTESTQKVSDQITMVTKFNATIEEKYSILKDVVSSLPKSNSYLKLEWSSWLLLNKTIVIKEDFKEQAKSTIGLRVDKDIISSAKNQSHLLDLLNSLAEKETNNAIQNVFDLSDVENGVDSLLLSCLYFRAAFRAPVTLLNGTWDFRDTALAPHPKLPMFKINDVIRYARFSALNARVVEIPYAVKGLVLTIFIPDSRDHFDEVAKTAANPEIHDLFEKRSTTKRVELTLPVYTLRMTLLLPNKLDKMGLNHILDANNGGLYLSHGAQMIMFWADSAQNAYKDDGYDWEPPAEEKILVDIPYVFVVKYNDMELLTGNFVN